MGSTVYTHTVQFNLGNLTEGVDTVDMSDFKMPVTVHALGGNDDITTGTVASTVYADLAMIQSPVLVGKLLSMAKMEMIPSRVMYTLILFMVVR